MNIEKIDDIEDEEWAQIIMKSKDLELSSFSFKILLGQLKTRIELSGDAEILSDAIKDLKKYIMKYNKLPNLQNDLNKIFNKKL